MDQDNAIISCIVVNNRLKTLTDEFTLTVPCEDRCHMIFTYLRIAAPALRDKDHAKFNLYKSLNNTLPHQLNELNQTHIDLKSPVSPIARVEDAFPFDTSSQDFSRIGAIIFLDDDMQDRIRTVQHQRSQDGLLPLITIRLSNVKELSHPNFTRLCENSVVEVPVAELPAFVRQFDQDLLLPRSPERGMTPPYPDFVKTFLGDDEYCKYFTGPSDNSATRCAPLLEFMHYSDILFDTHILDPRAFRASKEAHVYSLLRRLASKFNIDSGVSFALGIQWPLSLLLIILEADEEGYQYVPHNNFSITMRGFPALLLDVTSDKGEEGGKEIYRILLQASCLVRLGNALLKDASLMFLVKAIYIDSEYYATEYTLYQRENSLNNGVHTVEYFSRTIDLSDTHDTFKFIFRLYNFLSSMREMCGKISRDFPFLSASLKNQIDRYPVVTPQAR